MREQTCANYLSPLAVVSSQGELLSDNGNHKGMR